MSDDAKALQGFGSSSHPGTIADFLGTVSRSMEYPYSSRT
jgi:hypothetical protein